MARKMTFREWLSWNFSPCPRRLPRDFLATPVSSNPTTTYTTTQAAKVGASPAANPNQALAAEAAPSGAAARKVGGTT